MAQHVQYMAQVLEVSVPQPSARARARPLSSNAGARVTCPRDLPMLSRCWHRGRSAPLAFLKTGSSLFGRSSLFGAVPLPA